MDHAAFAPASGPSPAGTQVRATCDHCAPRPVLASVGSLRSRVRRWTVACMRSPLGRDLGVSDVGRRPRIHCRLARLPVRALPERDYHRSRRLAPADDGFGDPRQ